MVPVEPTHESHHRFEANFEVLKRKGTFVSYGNVSGPIEGFNPLKLGGKNIKFVRPGMQNYVATPEEATGYGTKLFSLMVKGAIKPHVHKEYALTAEGLQDGHRELEGGKATGKLLVKVVPE